MVCASPIVKPVSETERTTKRLFRRVVRKDESGRREDVDVEDVIMGGASDL